MVVAIGFQSRWFERLLGGEGRRRLQMSLAGDELERRIDLDLPVAGLSPEIPIDAWESDDCVRRTVVMPVVLSERLAAQAERRKISVSDLLVEYADEGLRRDGAGD